MTDADVAIPKGRWNLGVTSLASAIAGHLLGWLVPTLTNADGSRLSFLLPAVALSLVGLACGIAGVVRSARDRDAHGGPGVAIAGVAVSVLSVVVFFLLQPWR